MSRYTVLWIDDEADDEFLDNAYDNGIDIKVARCHNDGVIMLKDSSTHWDAVILDANCKISNSSSEAPSLDSLTESIKSITEFCVSDRFIPWFIYTGGAYESFNSLPFMISKERIWDDRKYYNKPADYRELFENIKKAADSNEYTKVKMRYFDVLSVLDVINSSNVELIDILLSVNGYKTISHKTYFTQLRLIIELIFRDANKRGLLHDKCISKDSKVNLTESSLFLAGKPTNHLGIKCSKQHFPYLIAENIKNILFITGGASHTAEPDEKGLINLQGYWEFANTPYLLYSLTFMLCDILLWYKKYSSNNSNYETNISYWENITTPTIKGEVIKILEGVLLLSNHIILLIVVKIAVLNRLYLNLKIYK